MTCSVSIRSYSLSLNMDIAPHPLTPHTILCTDSPSCLELIWKPGNTRVGPASPAPHPSLLGHKPVWEHGAIFAGTLVYCFLSWSVIFTFKQKDCVSASHYDQYTSLWDVSSCRPTIHMCVCLTFLKTDSVIFSLANGSSESTLSLSTPSVVGSLQYFTVRNEMTVSIFLFGLTTYIQLPSLLLKLLPWALHNWNHWVKGLIIFMSLDESFWETHLHGPFGAPVDTTGGGWRWFSSELHSMTSGDCKVLVS